MKVETPNHFIPYDSHDYNYRLAPNRNGFLIKPLASQNLIIFTDKLVWVLKSLRPKIVTPI